MPTKIQLRRGTSAAWAVADPVLAEGEIGMATDLGRLKVGDGVRAWTALDYYDLDLDQAVAAALPEVYGADDQFVTESMLAAVGPSYGPPAVEVVVSATLTPEDHVQYVCANDVELEEPTLTAGRLFSCRIRMDTGAMVTYPEGWFLGGYCPLDRPYVVELTSADGEHIHAQVIPFEYASGSGASAAESIKVATWGSDASDGTTWAAAKLTVEAGAAAAAAAGKQLWIGTGTYDAPADEGFRFGGAVRVYGGFQGDEESLAERARTPEADGRGCATYTCPTILRNRVVERTGAIAIVLLAEPADPTAPAGSGQGPVFEGLSFLDSPRVTSGEGAMFVDCLISGMAAPGQNGVLSNSILFGCTVAGNTAGTGGGLYNCSAANCRITGNVATLHGGGAGFGAFVNCLIHGNSVASGATDGHGGGLYCATSASDCTISGNTLVKGNGAGAFDCGRISSCLVTGNTAQNGSGGGLSNCDLVTDCTVSGNVARTTSGGGRGGGLNDCGMVYRTLICGNTSYCSAFAGAGCQGTPSQYFSCTIMENVARSIAGGIAGNGGGALDGKFYGCWFIGNQAATGAGMFISEDTARLYNCVFLRNHCADAVVASPVSGLYASASGIVANCTFLHNQCVGGTGTKYTVRGTLTMYNCLFWRNNGEGDGSTGTKANNKLEADLALADFEDPLDWATGLVPFPHEFDALVRAGRYSPSNLSALLNSGDSSKNTTTTDILGLPRKVGDIDIGAFERQY